MTQKGVYIPIWKQEKKISNKQTRVNCSERIKKFPKQKTETKSSIDQILNERHSRKKPKYSSTVYNNDFYQKPSLTERAKNPSLIKKKSGKIVSGSETYKTTYHSSFNPLDLKNGRVPSVNKKSKEWSENRVKLSNSELNCSSYNRDFHKLDFDSSFSVKNISTTKELSDGSCKGSSHISRYQGFVPSDRVTMKKMKDTRVERNNFSKGFLSECQVNIPGYSGFVPTNRTKPFEIDKRTTKENDYVNHNVDPSVTKEFGIKNLTLKQFFTIDQKGGKN